MSTTVMTRRLSPRFVTGGIVLLATALLFAVVSLTTAPAPHTVTTFDAAERQYDLANLAQESRIIALVRPTGQRSSRWNSLDNKPWTAARDSGLVPMIYTDQSVVVEQAWRGAATGDILSVRTVGGLSGGHEFRDADAEPLEDGATYLVFLRLDDWPGRDLVDQRILSPVGRIQGVFRSGDRGFVNRDGLGFTLDQLERSAG